MRVVSNCPTEQTCQEQGRSLAALGMDGADLSSAQPPHLARSYPFTLLIQVPDLPHGHPSFSVQLNSIGPACLDSVSSGSLCLAGFISVAQKDATKPR